MKALKAQTPVGAIAALCAGTVIFPNAGNSQSCDSADALRRIQAAETAGIFLGVSATAGVPTVAVDLDTWSRMNKDTRIGFARTVECAAVGPGKVMVGLNIISGAGVPLAEWDGLGGELKEFE